MQAREDVFEAGPAAAALVEGLRDFGYTLETALADVVDNSLTAAASVVEILADFNAGDPRIAILDDGRGMSPEQLREAMRPGGRVAPDKRSSHDLGHFGLGMKTASFSQGKRLTVLTKRSGVISAARWDLDFVASTNKWLVQVPSNPEALPWADRLGESGTLVIWEKLDRLASLGSEHNEREFNRRLSEARRYLEEVFHRFLQPELGHQAVAILLNGLLLEAYDPFHSKHPATIKGPRDIIGFAGGRVVVQAFTLPHHSKVSPDDWEKYAGDGGYLRNQGFYLYRARRLIVRGTWFGLARQLSTTQLARVRIDIPNSMDSHWKVNVLKASAYPPPAIRDRLRGVHGSLAGDARKVYTHRGRRLADAVQQPLWERRQAHGQISYEVNPRHPAVASFATALPRDLQAAHGRLLEMISAALPIEALFVDLGDHAEQVRGGSVSDDALAELVATAWRGLMDAAISPHDAERILRSSEPFRSNWDRVSHLLSDGASGGA